MKTWKVVTASVVAIALSASAGSALAWATTVRATEPEVAPVSAPEPKPFETNDAGETYGSAMGAPSDPDLIYAEGEGGVVGYIRAIDINGPQFNSPEEALKYQEEHNLLSGEDRPIPLYASDGVTVIGTFVLRGSASGDAGPK